MTARASIRDEQPGDEVGIRAVNDQAFGRPNEGLLVDYLREDGLVVLSLVAELGGELVGHILFSALSIETGGELVRAATLGPLAVVPGHQNQGIGASLTRHGLERCREFGIEAVVLLGHPTYYPRFGFSADLASHLESLYKGPAFMALELVPGALDIPTGKVIFPDAFSRVE